jgi:hypothetical protein
MTGPSPPNIKLPGLSLHTHRRGRSSSFVKVEHVDSSNEEALDQAAYANNNAEWVNRKGGCSSGGSTTTALWWTPWYLLAHYLFFIGAWMIHVVLIAIGKVIIDVIPGMTQNISWTTVNLCYLAVRPLPYYPKAPYPPTVPSS